MQELNLEFSIEHAEVFHSSGEFIKMLLLVVRAVYRELVELRANE